MSASIAGPGTPRPVAGTPRPSAGTPRPTTVGTPRPGSTRPSLPPVVVAGTPQRTGTGTPTSAYPRTTTPHPLSATPLSAGGERGVKREREREGPANGMPMQNGQIQNGVQAPAPVIAAARAGIPGVRPRPVKKQRVVRGVVPAWCIHLTFRAGYAGPGARCERNTAATDAAGGVVCIHDVETTIRSASDVV